jgi:hypothetical protein
VNDWICSDSALGAEQDKSLILLTRTSIALIKTPTVTPASDSNEEAFVSPSTNLYAYFVASFDRELLAVVLDSSSSSIRPQE